MEPHQASQGGGEAFTLYQEARSHWQRRTPMSVRLAIRCLERAISLGGSFPKANAALADCYSILLDYGVLSPREGMMAARLASGRALYQGPELAESLTAAALVRQMDLDWAGAETEFRAAIEAHPDYTVARQRFAIFLALMGRDKEGRREMEAALQLNPDSPAVASSAAWILYYQGKFQEALDAARDVVLRYPHFASAEVVLALSFIAAGSPDRGAVVLQDARKREEENVSFLSLLSYAKGIEGNRRGAELLMTELRSWADDRYVSPYYLAVPYVGMERHAEAVDGLERAVEERAPQVVYLSQEPIFRNLRGESRFQSLLARLGLPYRPGERGSSVHGAMGAGKAM